MGPITTALATHIFQWNFNLFLAVIKVFLLKQRLNPKNCSFMQGSSKKSPKEEDTGIKDFEQFLELSIMVILNTTILHKAPRSFWKCIYSDATFGE
ncbi:hypothetical protein AVEN_232529-1 [Araneus ventricosus]|uniref:PiggyBac transposable element-derived protein domain-containing protein n=1 Tax=Araneus ventricosus TaxID=182803 RepID=A0A4Y2TD76_ARAVE|nr:hypothetical protein AVEN_232529-1 [Araneus ventricosus]